MTGQPVAVVGNARLQQRVAAVRLVGRRWERLEEALYQLPDLPPGSELILASSGSPEQDQRLARQLGYLAPGLVVSFWPEDEPSTPQLAGPLPAAGNGGDLVEAQVHRLAVVFSPKGGAGKTVVAVNLACALAQRGASTLLVDLDLAGADAAVHLDLLEGGTLLDLLPRVGTERAWEVVRVHRCGLHLAAAPPRPELRELADQDAILRLVEAAQTRYAWTVVDTSPDASDGLVYDLLARAQARLLVATPDPSALRRVRAQMRCYRTLLPNLPAPVLIINRDRGNADWGDANIMRLTGLRPGWHLPEEPKAMDAALLDGMPLVLSEPASPFASSLQELAARLTGTAAGSPGRRDLWAAGRRLIVAWAGAKA